MVEFQAKCLRASTIHCRSSAPQSFQRSGSAIFCGWHDRRAHHRPCPNQFAPRHLPYVGHGGNFPGTHKSAPQIARELGVDALVEGSVVRSGNKVRITAQLIHAASDRHLWARTYDRELSDVLTVQSEVAREIADSISLRLTPQERAQLSRSHPVNPEIALLYFKGSYFLNKLDAPRAEEAFTEAIHLDPNSAESWAGLADALHTAGAVGQQYDAFPRARDAANKALEIDPSQPRALMVLGVVSFIYEWNLTAVGGVFCRRSLEASPGNAVARALFATILAHRGKAEEAIQRD